MIPILKSFSILTLAVFLISTALFPLAQAQAAEDIQVEPNMAEEPATLTPLLYGLWLTEVSEEYTDIHLWYKINPELTSATSIDGTTQTYDNNGNLTSDSTWNYQNRLIQAGSPTATSTLGVNNLIKRFFGTVLLVSLTFYPFVTFAQEATALSEIPSGFTPVYLFASEGGEILGIVPIAENLAIGCVSSIATSTEAENLQETPPDPTCFLGGLNSGSTTPATESGAGEGQRIFTGHEYDRDTGLNYMGARYYDAAIGRFLSQDPAFWGIVTGIADPQLVNSYAYARGNPLTYNDPDGQWPSLAQTNSFLARVDRYNPLHPLFGSGADNLYHGYRNQNYGQIARGAGDIALNGALVIGGALDLGLAAGEAYNVYQRYASYNAAVNSLLSPREFQSLPEKGTLDPSKIRFSQDSISSNFRNGGSVDDLTQQLKNGYDPSKVSPIRIVDYNNGIYTLDNRRLQAFQQAGVDVPYQKVEFNSLGRNDLAKFSTINEGTSIELRGGGSR